jgi:polysaccharide export outer membrane protein
MGVVLPLKKPVSILLRLALGAAVFSAASAISARAQTNGTDMYPVAPPQAVPLDNTIPALPPSQDYAASINTMDALNNERKLAVGDTLSYRVVEEQKEPVTMTVKASGEINVPLLGLYPAAGKTCKQLAEELKPLLQKDYFYTATVIIGLDTESTQSLGKVYIMGQVHTQGSIELPANETLTVSQAVLMNGGLADFADKHHVKLLRKGPDGKTTTTNVDIQAVYVGKSTKDPVLQPGDTINVTEKLINF